MRENRILQEILEVSRDILEEIKRQRVWFKFGGFMSLKRVIDEVLTSDVEKIIYELSDGRRSTRDIAKHVNQSHVTVSNMWKKWLAYGIVEPSDRYKGRFKKVISLNELGISVPEIKKGESNE